MCYKCKVSINTFILMYVQITQEFQQLNTVYQTVISDICCKMGNGMVVFLQRDVESLEEWNEVLGIFSSFHKSDKIK